VIENKTSSFIEAVFAEKGNSQLSANNQTGSVDYMRLKANVINLDYSHHHIGIMWRIFS
jgi:hypothetical protein